MSDTNTQIRSGTDQTAIEANNEPGRDTLLEVNDLQRQLQLEHYLAGGFSGQNSSANDFGFIHGGNTTSTAHYPDARAPMAPNAPAANIQERDPTQLLGGIEMFAMPNQRSIPSNAQREPSHPPFNHLSFAHGPPTSQNTRFSFNQYTQGLNPGMPDTGARPPFARQPPQPTTPSAPQLSFPFWGHHFQSFGQVTEYMNEVAWYPSMGRYGLPQTSEQYKVYLEKICLALRNMTNVWDIETAPWQYGKFIPGGEWTEAQDIEAIAHTILLAAMRIHIFGVTDFAHTRSVDYMSFSSEDVDFTFPQRIHFVACLLHHSKAAAAEVMAKVHIDKYVAAPMTALRSMDQFENSWQKVAPADKKSMLEIAPYVGSGVTHPSPEVQAHLTSMAAARYRQTYNARQRRDSATGSTVNARGQTLGEQDGGMGRRWSTTSEGASPSTPATNAGPSRAQSNTRVAVPDSNGRFRCPTPHPGQSSGEGASSSDIASI